VGLWLRRRRAQLRMSIARLAWQVVVIVCGGFTLGLVLNGGSPRPIVLSEAVFPSSAPTSTGSCSSGAPSGVPREFPRMPLKEGLAACGGCSAAFVDARGAAAFARGHVAGALHLPLGDEAELRETIDRLRSFETVVVYDDDVGCKLARGVATRLAQEGLRDVRLLEGSWREWEAARGPAQTGACEACGAPGDAG
jgi:rhodanese-related sulfurtransferase